RASRGRAVRPGVGTPDAPLLLEEDSGDGYAPGARRAHAEAIRAGRPGSRAPRHPFATVGGHSRLAILEECASVKGVCSGLRRLPVAGPARPIVLAARLLFPPAAHAWPAEPVCPPSAVVPTQDQLQEAVRNARDHGALWRFEKDGRHGYLYGTIHI